MGAFNAQMMFVFAENVPEAFRIFLNASPERDASYTRLKMPKEKWALFDGNSDTCNTQLNFEIFLFKSKK
jgi:hypothetical protein